MTPAKCAAVADGAAFAAFGSAVAGLQPLAIALLVVSVVASGAAIAVAVVQHRSTR